MKADRFKIGCVFKYPYKWHYTAGQDIDPKQRPVCMILRIPSSTGGERIAIVPISDRPTPGEGLSIEVPLEEAAAAGLNPSRRAFIHLNEVNFDRIENSYSFNPNARILGRFSKVFIERMTRQLVDNIKNKRITATGRI